MRAHDWNNTVLRAEHHWPHSLKSALRICLGSSFPIAIYEAALATAQEWAADAALLDIGMPGMDGFTLATKLRAIPAYKSAKLIALTGYGQPEDLERIQSSSFDHHLVKPAPMTELSRVLEDDACRRARNRSVTGIRVIGVATVLSS